MKHAKKLIALLTAFVLLLSFGMTALAADPSAGDIVYVNTRNDAVNSATGKAYITDTGSAYDYLTVREYNENPCYCIEKGEIFTRTRYKAVTMSSSSYWNSLSKTARDGIALTAAFGYPAQSAAALGVPSGHDAYAATQAIIWEYQQGYRTSPQNLTDTRHQRTLSGTPAMTAYTNILNKMKAYISDPRYENNIQSTAGFICLTSESGSIEQEIICFYGKTPEYEQLGKIEIYKSDSNNNKLNGAEFAVYDSHGIFRYTIAVNGGYGYVRDIPFGTYTVTETKFPDGYYAGNYQTSWTVTLNEKTPDATVTINAVNEQIPGSCKIVKTSEDGRVDGVSFKIEGNGINKTVTTKDGGQVKIDNLKPGIYTVTEITEDKYEPQETRRVTVVSGQTATVTFNNTLKRGNLTVTKTSEDGLNAGIRFHLYGVSLSGLEVDEYAVTDKSGKAYFNDVLIGSGYVLEETNTPDRYVIPDRQTAEIEWNRVTEKSFYNSLKKWRLTVTKSDKDTGTAQGDASLAGAVYGIYKGGQLADKYTTDKNGQFTTKYYVCGTDWTVREISAGEGYLVTPDSERILGAEPGQYTAEYNSAAMDVYETVKKGSIAVIKHSGDGSTGIETPESGAEFEVFLKSAGSYKNAKETERDIIVTDSGGYAVTKKLPYGVYTVRQTKGAPGKELMKPFNVSITEDGKVYRYIINNADFKSYVEIVKKDAETGQVIPAAGIAFKVRNLATGEYVKQHIVYPTPHDTDIFCTDTTGMLMMPEPLNYGKYEIIEQSTAYGYVLDSKPVPFEIDGTKAVVTVEKYNMPQKGRITVEKTGEIFWSVSEKDGVYTPVYSVGGLKGAVFNVTAAEDIVTPDGTLRYMKGETVDIITTDADGQAVTKELYLGEYEVTETEAAYGTVLNKTPQTVVLTYDGETISVTGTEVSFYNERQKAVISIDKILEQDESFGTGSGGEILSVKFGLYAAEEITAADGSGFPADGLIDTVYCGENGKAVFKADIPVGAKFYVKEISSDEHYLVSDEIFPAEFVPADSETALFSITLNNGEPVINRIIYGSVKGFKADSKTGKGISGALFGIFKSDETVFSEETAVLTALSDENGVFEFLNVPYGQWIIKELKPADGYKPTDKEYKIQISENGETVNITVTNKKIPEIPKTGEDRKPAMLLAAIALSALIIIKIKKRSYEK